MEGSYDPFIQKFFSRIHGEVAASFTDEQLNAIKLAFGARDWGTHAIDMRKSVRFLWFRWYFVLLAGKERRPADRLNAESRPFGTLSNALMTTVFLFFLLSPVLVLLYGLKTATGIDIFPDGGWHDILNSLGGQIDRLLK